MVANAIIYNGCLFFRTMPGVITQLPSGKNINYGIEAVNQLVWTGWEPGREYTKNIVLKNVRIKTQKLKFK